MHVTVPIETTSFAGHESFPLRFGWLKKGYDAVAKDPHFFSRDRALVDLGVGKNMVRAIRHWGLACGAWVETAQTRGRELELTSFGNLLLADDGWDPYLEDPGTIWWLHWRLVNSPDRATSWTWTFARPKANRFSKEVLATELADVAASIGGQRSKRSSIKRDLDVLVRSYARQPSDREKGFEDSLDSPFALLGLVRPAIERGEYEIVQGTHSSLPLGVFEAALVEYCTRGSEQRRSVSLDELLYAPLSPGRTFRLSEDAFMERLLRLDRRRDLYRFDETAGLRQLLLPNALPAPHQVLTDFYAKRRHEVAA